MFMSTNPTVAEIRLRYGSPKATNPNQDRNNMGSNQAPRCAFVFCVVLGHFGPCWGHLGAIWAVFGSFWSDLVRFWADLCRFVIVCVHMGAFLGRFGRFRALWGRQTPAMAAAAWRLPFLWFFVCFRLLLRPRSSASASPKERARENARERAMRERAMPERAMRECAMRERAKTMRERELKAKESLR